jgi:hypothetical protein
MPPFPPADQTADRDANAHVDLVVDIDVNVNFDGDVYLGAQR